MKLKYKLVLLVLIPIVALGVCVSVVSCYFSEQALINSVRNQLRVAVEGYDEGDDVYCYQDMEVDITVFEGDTRVLSSIEGAVGTKASDAVIQKVLNNGETYFDENLLINGTRYFGYYLPTEKGMLFAGKQRTDVVEVINQLIFAIVLVSITMMIVITVVASFIVRKLAKSISNASETVSLVADGDLTCEVSAMTGKDEVTAMNNHVMSMVQNLKDMITKTSHVSQDVQSSVSELHSTATSTLNASEEIARAIEDVAYNNTKQATIASDISTSLDVMNEKTEDIVTCVDGIENCTADLTENCNIMRSRIETTRQSSEQMSGSVVSIKEKIDATNKVISKMAEILASIEDIASETKLLSLNASIEAARAGEAGSGFAVVADSISTLSDNTANELVSIKEIISNITADFRDCAVCIDEVVENNSENMQGITEVIDSFKQVDNAIQDTSKQVDAISRAVAETSEQIAGMTSEVRALGEMSESNAAASEEVNASVQEMTALMHTVDKSAEALSIEASNLIDALSIFKY